jgi:hypothetical protein
VDGHAERDRLNLEHCGRSVLAEVGLREQDRGLSAALPRGCEVPLEAAEVEVVVERGDEKDGVDVGADDLRLGRVPRRFADDRAPAREHGVDRARAVFWSCGHRDPVAGRGQFARARLVAQFSRDLGVQLAELREDDVAAAVRHGDAAGDEAGGGVLLEVFGEVGAPAEIVQRQADLLRT